MLSNPHTQPQFAAQAALLEPVNPHATWFGRDAAVRWFAYENLDPRGVTDLKYIFDWQNTDSASTRLVSFIESDQKHEGFLHVGWDVGIVIYLGDEIVFDQRN